MVSKEMMDMSKPLHFSGKNVPINTVAKIMAKEAGYIRQAMADGKLPLGIAYMKEGSSQYDYYISIFIEILA